MPRFGYAHAARHQAGSAHYIIIRTSYLSIYVCVCVCVFHGDDSAADGVHHARRNHACLALLLRVTGGDVEIRSSRGQGRADVRPGAQGGVAGAEGQVQARVSLLGCRAAGKRSIFPGTCILAASSREGVRVCYLSRWIVCRAAFIPGTRTSLVQHVQQFATSVCTVLHLVVSALWWHALAAQAEHAELHVSVYL